MSEGPEQYHDLEAGHLQHAAEHETPRKKPSVLTYLVILFAAAFLLMALSYLMQQRASTETIQNLKASVSAMQSVESIQKANEELQAQVAALEDRVKGLQDQTAALEAEKKELQTAAQAQAKAAEAMDWFWRIQREVSRGRYSGARALVEDFQAAGLESFLPTDHPADADGPSPADQFQEILALLY